MDDDKSFRVSISRLLRAAGYDIRSYLNVAHFLLARLDEAPGCILLDVRMPGINGLELQEVLATRAKTLPIIFLSGYGDVPSIARAMKGGAIDFLAKPVRSEALLNAIDNAMACDARGRVSREQLRRWLADYGTLSPHELEILNLVAAGKTNNAIAGELNIAERTVKAHRAQIMNKMHVSSLAELMRIADKLDSAGVAMRAGAKH